MAAYHPSPMAAYHPCPMAAYHPCPMAAYHPCQWQPTTPAATYPTKYHPVVDKAHPAKGNLLQQTWKGNIPQQMI